MAKEKSLAELRADKAQAIARAKEITDLARKEERKLSDVEMKEHNDLQVRTAELNIDIAAHEERNKGKGTPHAPTTDKPFSFRRAILAHMNGREQGDSEARAIEEATRLHSTVGTASEDQGGLILPFTRAAYTAGTEAATGVVIDEEQQELLLPLEPNLVLTQAGVRMMTGLQGNIYWPNHSAVSAFWEGENDEAQDGAGEFEKGTVYGPKRLAAYVDISKQLLVQENRSVEGLIRNLMAIAIAQKLEKTAFSADATDPDIPDGMFQGFDNAKGAISWANVVGLETAADLQNALFGNLAYILHPSLVGAAKTKVKDASGAGGFIFGNDGQGFLNGYRALRTNNIPTGLAAGEDEHGIVFGNWADYFLGQWGGMDIIVDPYTQARKAMVRLVVNSYWNMGVIRNESFTVASMK